MSLKIVVNKHRCIGAETCIQLAPTAFAWSPDEIGKAVLLDPSSVEEEILREAEAACPTAAIVIEDVDE